MNTNLTCKQSIDNILQTSLSFRFIGINIQPIWSMQKSNLSTQIMTVKNRAYAWAELIWWHVGGLKKDATATIRSNQTHGIKVHMTKYQITSRHHMHMTHGLVGTNKTSLNVVTVSASVKQQHYHCIIAILEHRSYEAKNYQPWNMGKALMSYFKSWNWRISKRGIY